MTNDEKTQIENLPFPVVFSCVDMIVYSKSRDWIVMIKKDKNDLFRIPGGMIDPLDLNNLEAARRELGEEVNIWGNEVKNPKKIGEFLVYDSGRYDSKSSKHRLKSYLYQFELDDENPLIRIKAGDDAKEVYQIPVNNLFNLEWSINNVLPTHIPMLYTWLSKQNKIS